MERYNDWAIMGAENQQMASKEYKKISKSKAYSVDFEEKEEGVFEKIAYLKSLLPILKEHNKNVDVRQVIDEIEYEISIQAGKLHKIFHKDISALETNIPDTQIFCNNLKLSIQTCLEIIKILEEEKNKQDINEQKQKDIAHVLNEFLNITKKYVSLFGECKYRVFNRKY